MSLLSFPLSSVLWSRGRPGLAPAGDFLSLSRQRKEAKKGEPGASSLCYAQGTLRCSDRAGDPQTRPAGSNMRLSFSARSCATRLRTRQWGSEYEYQTPRQQGRAMARPCGVRLLGFPSPCVCAEKRSGGRIKRRACLSAASLRGSRLARASQVAPAQPGSQTPGSPFFAYFLWRSKESESPAGARPGKATPARAAHGAN
jgi:hypothetical protein